MGIIFRGKERTKAEYDELRKADAASELYQAPSQPIFNTKKIVTAPEKRQVTAEEQSRPAGGFIVEPEVAEDVSVAKTSDDLIDKKPENKIEESEVKEENDKSYSVEDIMSSDKESLINLAKSLDIDESGRINTLRSRILESLNLSN